MTAWERESEELLGRSGAVAAIVPGHWAERDYVGMVDGLRRRLPALRQPFAMGAERRGAVRLDPLAGDDRWRRRRIDPNGPSSILSSSGTEALPKLVLYSHNGMANLRVVPSRSRISAAVTGGPPVSFSVTRRRISASASACRYKSSTICTK